MKILLLVFFLVSASCSAEGAGNVALLGAWNCGPYNMAGKGFDMTAAHTAHYAMDGSYRVTSELIVRAANGKIVKMRDRSFGSWTLKDDIIEIHYDKVEFLSSDDPAYTVQMGQASADAQQTKKNWAKSRILELGEKKLITVAVESMYKGAEVTVTCLRG